MGTPVLRICNKSALFIILSLALFSCRKQDNIFVTEVISVNLSQSELLMVKDDTCMLNATVLPENATYKIVTWHSNNTAVATVDNGLVTAIDVGDAVITATAEGKTKECKITVIEEGKFHFGIISTDAAIINGAGGTTQITMTASKAWKLSSNASWLTLSPDSGVAGSAVITVTTSANYGNTDRVGTVSVFPGGQSQSWSICQRPYIYERKQVADGTISNSVKLTYSGTQWFRIYAILPVPKSSLYQEIYNLDTFQETILECPDSVNSYITTDLLSDRIPQSGGNVLSESFGVKAFEVSVKLDIIDNIPPYDEDSKECRNYIGKEDNGLIDPTDPSVTAVADALWSDSKGGLIEYARKCYEWTAQNISYGNMNTGLHTIEELMRTRTGDCGNFCSVFISLLRAKGIPARHIVMISPQESGYHVRAEFYIPAYGWIPADPTMRNANPTGDFFGRFTGKYVVMSTGINSTCKAPDGNEFTAQLLQSCYYWYWYYSPGTTFTFSHTFSDFN